MTPEQIIIQDCHKGIISEQVCADMLIESLSITHPTLAKLLDNSCWYDEIIKITSEVLHIQNKEQLCTCPECGSTDYCSDNTNTNKCNKCGTFFTLKKI